MKALRSLVLFGSLALPVVATAAQPYGCAAPAPAAAAQQPAATYRSYSYQPAQVSSGYRSYSYRSGAVQGHAYENAANKSLGRVD